MAFPAPARRLGLIDATMIITGSMIGGGIFLAPAIIAGIMLSSGAGPGSFILIWIVGGMLTLCGALSFGELAAAMPATGGQYVFLSKAFSRFWGYLYGWTVFSVIQTGFIAAVAVAFANYLGVFFPWISGSNRLIDAAGLSFTTVQLAAIGLIAALTLLNARGLKEAAVLQNIFSFTKMGALAALILAGLLSGRGDWTHFQPFLPPAINIAVLAGIAVAMSKALFAYDAWNVVTFLAEEARDPARTLPRALFLGTLSVTLIYTLTNTSFLYVLSLPEAAAAPDQRIAAHVAGVVVGPAAVTLIAAAILVSTAGCVNGLILSGPWLYHAMAKDGLFFAGAAQLHPATRLPFRSLLYQSAWAVGLVLTGSLGARGAQLFSDLLTFTSFASLLFNALTVAGLFVLRRTLPDMPRPYRVPAYPILPALYIATAVFFLVFVAIGDPRNAGFGALVIAAGVIPYLYWKGATA